MGLDKVVIACDERIAAKTAGLDQRPLTRREVVRHCEVFGIDEEMCCNRQIQGFSAGQKVRLSLAAMFWTKPHLIALDEPTNYLDVETVEALAKALNTFRGGVVMIEPKTDFVERICNEKWHLQDGKVTIHPKSLNYEATEFSPSWLCYHTKVKTSAIFLHDCSEVSPLALMFFGARFQRSQKSGAELVDVGEDIHFLCNTDTANMIENLRRHWDELLRQRVSNPGATDWSTASEHRKLLRIIIDVVASEDSDSAQCSIQDQYEIPLPARPEQSASRRAHNANRSFDRNWSPEESLDEWDDSDNDLSLPEDL